MDENKSYLPKPAEEKVKRGEFVDNSNDLRKDLNSYDQHMTNEHLNIGKSLDRHINLQEVTFSKINQIRQNNDAIRYNLAMNDFQKNRFFQDVNFFHSSSINNLNFKGIYIWKNESGNSIYYRLDSYGNRIKCNNDEEILKLFFPNHIKIYEKIEDVIIDNYPIFVRNLIPIIRDDVFYPLLNREWFFIQNIQYRNLFNSTVYTPLSINIPIQNTIKIEPIRNSTIETFIEYLVEDNDSFGILMKVLVNFHKSKFKSNYAFVLIGDENSIDIFINEIIKPLFSSKDEYFSTIDDKLLDKKVDAKIIEDKIFYHVKNLSEANLKSKRVRKLIFDIVRPNKITADNAILNNETYVWGELFITSSKNNPHPALEDIYSKCIVIKVKNLKTILKKMNIDKISLIENMQADLFNFSNLLASSNFFDIKQDVYKLQQKEEYINLRNMLNGIIYTNDLNKKIREFVIAIQYKKILFFNKILVENKELYDELLYNFEEDMIAQPILSEYFNIINDDIIFEENSYLLDILKQEYEMFKITPKDESKYNGKKRYKIF
ncbi:hypothetical protein AVENP_2301 [Arcobacter venerupis]|uniref:Uncharacterized protein n=1 Tax=Arcobacter venerupis TaxID=1054033 RepID=A0AAE7B9J0_9BACT|nr:hypothetical protein [Arcobacter venerupis]QKF67829.1 hypothetical protein AVENP_2301 [Arcobacter venerupis]RWS49436.1 hypothetical protein CKA56_08615 [Arcobacter venerupis]